MSNAFAIAANVRKKLQVRIDELEKKNEDLNVMAGRAIINLPPDLRQEDWPASVGVLRRRVEQAEAKVEELVRSASFWQERYNAIQNAFAHPEKLPDPATLKVFMDFSKWPEDYETGKYLQRHLGFDAIPPVTECECGAGFWYRLTGQKEGKN